jgi:hypothetical protein
MVNASTVMLEVGICSPRRRLSHSSFGASRLLKKNSAAHLLYCRGCSSRPSLARRHHTLAPSSAALRVAPRHHLGLHPHPPRPLRKGRQGAVAAEACTTTVPHQVGHAVGDAVFQAFSDILQAYVSSVSYRCCKVDRDVAYVAMVVHICCKRMFPMFHLFSYVCCKSVYLDVT